MIGVLQEAAPSIDEARTPRFGRLDDLGRHLAGDLRHAWPLDVVNALLDEASAADPSLATVAQLVKVPRVHVLGTDSLAGRRIPTNRLDAASLVSAAIVPVPRVIAG